MIALAAILIFTTSIPALSRSLYDVPREQAIIYSGGESTNPRSYDPATTHGSGDKLIFSGLVALDPKMNLIPDIAESWTVSADGMTYTFKIRANAKFHDGRAVTAQDFVYAWERAADPATESDTVLTYLGDIVGVKDMRLGQADHIAGINALDDQTLQVTIDAPKPYFLLKLTYPTAFVLDQQNIESGSEWYRTPNGTGPYKLIEWRRFEQITYQRNESYYLGAPAIPYVIVKIYSGNDFRMYESDEIDVAGVPFYNAARVLDPTDLLHDELLAGVNLCTDYIAFDSTQPPFDDANVRRAFSLAIDRQKLIDVLYSGHAIAAKGVFPPGLPGYDVNRAALEYDPTQARALLKQSKYGDQLPPIVYTTGGIGSYADPQISALAQMWKQNLGVTITIENIEPNYYFDFIYGEKRSGQIFNSGWCADYPDPENFADVLFHTGSDQNLGRYSNAALDQLLEQARIERDVTKRIALYQQAEQMLVDDAAALFLTHSYAYTLVKPRVKGYVLTPIDIALERYLWLQP
jgi:oligopeptide transport system substrate-binding protein